LLVGTLVAVLPISGPGFSGSTGVSGLNVSDAKALNLSTILVNSSVGVIPRLDKSIGSNMGVGAMSSCVLVLWVLLIDGDPLGVQGGIPLLLNGYAGPNPDIRDIGVCTTGVCVAGGLSSSVLSKCSCSDSELSGALYVR